MKTLITLLLTQAGILIFSIISAYHGSGNTTVTLFILFLLSRHIGRRYRTAPATYERLAEYSFCGDRAVWYKRLLKLL